jgi:hypothetical protein
MICIQHLHTPRTASLERNFSHEITSMQLQGQILHDRAIKSLVCRRNKVQEAKYGPTRHRRNLECSNLIIGSRNRWESDSKGIANYRTGMCHREVGDSHSLESSASGSKRRNILILAKAWAYTGFCSRMATTRLFKSFLLRGQHRCFSASTHIPATRLNEDAHGNMYSVAENIQTIVHTLTDLCM